MAEISIKTFTRGHPDPDDAVADDRAPRDTTADDDWRHVAAVRRDPYAFAPLYDRYFGLVYAYALQRLRDADRAADASSIVFARALAAIRSDGAAPNRPGSSFRSWLMTIARNVVIDQYRRQPPPTSSLSDHALAALIPDGARTPEEHSLLAEERGRIERALAELPDAQRQIVELRAVGMKSREIAEILGMSVGAVKTANFRAYATLRVLLRDEREERDHGRV